MAVIQRASAMGKGPVVAVGSNLDPQNLLQLIRSGAREYIHVDRFRDEFPEAVDRLQQAGAVKPHLGRTFAVLAPVPGTGVTTIASGLAFALASKQPNQVVLAELTPGVPELALDLDLKPRYGVDALLADWERLDASMLRQAVVEHEAGVHVLAYPPETLDPANVPPAGMRQTVLLLRGLYEFVVLDMGHTLNPSCLEALRLADGVLVVVRLDVPSLRLARRFLKRLHEQNVPPDKVFLVANRYGQRKQVAWQAAEKTLGGKVRIWVPDDIATINYALNQGQPLVRAARRASITRRLDELAKQLNGVVK
jgi:pilus assembly protein CpaE